MEKSLIAYYYLTISSTGFVVGSVPIEFKNLCSVYPNYRFPSLNRATAPRSANWARA